MNKIAELLAKVDTLKASASAILDAVEASGRTAMTAEEQGRYDALKSELDAAKAEMAAAERLADARREMAATASRPALAFSTNEPNPATTAGFKSLAEFAVAVRGAVVGGGVDRRLAAPTNVHQGTGGDGEGFLIPTQFSTEIWNAVQAQDSLLARFTPEPTAARSVEFLRDETTPWGAAGVQANWRAEGTQMVASKMATKATRLELHDLYAFASVTEETLADAPRLSNQLTLKAAQAIAWKASDAVMWGDGVGKPLGFMRSGALISVAKESAQAADTIVQNNLAKAFSRLMMAPGSPPFWIANTDTFPQLFTMGFGGATTTPIFFGPGGLPNAPAGSLLGYPIVYSEHAATLGDAGDLVLVTPAGYMAAVRQNGPAFASSMHLYFDYGLQAFRWTFRMGGQPMLSAPVSPARGSATKSHFVALAERA